MWTHICCLDVWIGKKWVLVRERDRERMLLNTEKMEKEKLLKCDLSCFVASNQSRNYSDRSESEFQTRTESIEPQNYSNANSSSSPTPSLTCYSNSIFVAKMKTGGEPKMMTPTPKRRTRLKTLFFGAICFHPYGIFPPWWARPNCNGWYEGK